MGSSIIAKQLGILISALVYTSTPTRPLRKKTEHKKAVMNKRPDPEKLMLQEERAYEKSRRFNNLHGPAYNYGLDRETWCTVEKSNNTAHLRVNAENLKTFSETGYIGKHAQPWRPSSA